jgi:hypothetical protein
MFYVRVIFIAIVAVVGAWLVLNVARSDVSGRGGPFQIDAASDEAAWKIDTATGFVWYCHLHPNNECYRIPSDNLP